MPVEKITKNILLLNRPPDAHLYDSNYFLVRGEKPVLIDCGCGEAHDMLKKNLGKVGYTAGDISCIIGTHCHYDHVGGLAKIRAENPEVKFALHGSDAGFLECADNEATCADWVFYSSIEAQRVDVRFDGDTTFEAGGIEFDIFHMPGHSPGSICIRVEDNGKKILFASDCLVPGCDKVGSDYSEWERTIERLLEIDFDILLPGHPQQWMSNPFLAAMIQPFSRRLGVDVYRFIADRLRVPFWKFGVFQYANIMPVATRIGSLTLPRTYRV